MVLATLPMLCLVCAVISGAKDGKTKPFCHKGRGILPLDLDGQFGLAEQLCRLADAGAPEGEAPAEPLTGTNGRQKPQAVEPIIYTHGLARKHGKAVIGEPTGKAQRQEPVSDCAAKWGVASGTRRVDVNPLIVMRSGGELVDHRLVHRDPVRGADLLPDPCHQVCMRVRNAHDDCAAH